jgi:hypothetical protein
MSNSVSGRNARGTKQRSDQPSRVAARERREANGCAPDRSGPNRMPLEQLWTRRPDDEHGDAARVFCEVVEEVQHGLIGPMQVLEHEDCGTRLSDYFQEEPPGGERLLALRAGGSTGDAATSACIRVRARRGDTVALFAPRLGTGPWPLNCPRSPWMTRPSSGSFGT